MTVALGEHRRQLGAHVTARQLTGVLRHDVQAVVLIKVRQPIVHVHWPLHDRHTH